ncbi:hypothetical protein [Burkholderia cenocepacia]|uniref:hypothetical protein n=1 Tax=Burkholderia cenocepacia TaxID=95486 RepID=UPI0013DE8250|nr:hypothetical protein [Burkholderia cenocepacia]MCW3587354.1 hypothetical protein [Burkholderia cenocepacia]MCW3632558.1 hypothetical protein [Burkholderia cenocepacia]MCW5181789.1 hypothetical protein [Burkholderia cenocepacia]
MTILPQDSTVLRDAIAREQLPPWGEPSKKALAADAVIFIVAGISNHFEWHGAGAMVTAAVVLLLVILATAPRPRRRDRFFYLRPVSASTLQLLIERLSPDGLRRIEAARDRDDHGTLRNGHLQELLSHIASVDDQRAVWSKWAKK